MPPRIAGLLFLALAFSTPARADEAGSRLAQQVYDRPDGQDAVSSGTMLLAEQGGSPRSRSMHSFVLEKAPGETWSLIRFSAPDDIAGTGLLTQDHPAADSDQWVFLPALSKTRRIPGDRKGGNFVGSDLYYEDLQDRKPDKDSHTLRGTEKFQGQDCQILESVPVSADNSVYSKRVSWIHPQTLIALKVELYEGKASPAKRLEVLKISKVQGYWTVMESKMTNLDTGHSTRISLTKIAYDKNLPDSLFSQQTLEDPARDAEWRP
ncbi:MAG: outer membrane lipoprotein-sorting protein [Gammaproteobacteria bacterium]|nr:outer membrane lipoprotein-sorting protein [Gammaproteobacteria bacterium]